METKIQEIIMAFFDYLNDTTNEEVTQIELNPLFFEYGLHISGFRKQGHDEIEAHLKRLKPIRNSKELSDSFADYFKYTTEPIEEMWINVKLLNAQKLSPLFIEFKDEFFKMNSYELAKITFKDEHMTMFETIGVIFESKRNACKYTLNFRKLHKSVSQKFLHFGEIETQEITELDIVTSAAE